jgi:ATP-GRASP peptide maturase of grasp-with-spasm system
MILILSQATQEATTDFVMDWLECLGGRAARLNAEDLDPRCAFSLVLTRAGTTISLSGGGGESWSLPLDEVRAVWHRRWPRQRHQGEVAMIDARFGIAEQARQWLTRHLNLELRKLGEALLAHLKDRPWLGDPDTASPNKLLVLERAAAAGLDVPATLVTTRRAELARFAAAHGPLITKPVGEAGSILLDGRHHPLHTRAVEPDEIAALPAAFPASLFQERLDKSYELRVFYLAGECYAMAIFSQRDEQTRIDFRRYNHERPNRCVPYRLAPGVAERIDTLMRRLGLETGSLDLVKTPDGRIVFLEVNPVGQFSMVSRPCNYQLERRVAEILLQRAADGAA